MYSLLWFSLANAEPIKPDVENIEVGFKGSWQGKRFTNGSTLIQQGIHLEVDHKWQGITTHIDLMDGRVWGSESTYKTNNDNFANLYEGYVRLPLGAFGGAKHSLTIGKQEVNLNDERFLSKGSWALNGRTFNAVVARGDWSSGYWHGGFLQLRSGGTYEGQCGTPQCETVSAGDVLFFANTNVEWNSLYIRPYLLHLRENATADNLNIERRITNTGFRVEGTHPNAFYTLDGAIQTGQASSTITHQAWMGVAELGVKKDRFKSSIYLEHNSGDQDPTDKIDQDFESFLGRYHGLRGWSDQVGGTNLRDIAVKLAAPLGKQWTAILQAHQFQMDVANGNLYTHNDVLIGSVSDNSEVNLGKELDLVLHQKPLEGTSIKWGHSVYIPEGAKKEFSGSDPIHFSYIWLVVNR